MNTYNQQQMYQLAYKAQLKACKLYKKRKHAARVRATNSKYKSEAGYAKIILESAIAAPAVSDHQITGKRAEHAACKYLQDQGLTLLHQNLQCKSGEIDLIMQHGNTLVFLEVRKRNSKKYGGSAASISITKKQRLCKTAQYFLPYVARVHFNGIIPPARFDVIAIDSEKINWIQHAFELNIK